MSEHEEIHNGPRYHKPLQAGGDFGMGSDTESAFSRGRELFKAGRSYASLTARNKTLLDALRKGYNWQKKRTKTL